jgi:hypothetical protein
MFFCGRTMPVCNTSSPSSHTRCLLFIQERNYNCNALFIKDCGFATALLILRNTSTDGEFTDILVDFLRKNLNIVALYVQDNSTNTTEEGISRKQKFMNKYKSLYKIPQFMLHLQQYGSVDQELLVHIEVDICLKQLMKYRKLKTYNVLLRRVLMIPSSAVMVQ